LRKTILVDNLRVRMGQSAKIDTTFDQGKLKSWISFV
jgi:hypothetical protein